MSGQSAFRTGHALSAAVSEAQLSHAGLSPGCADVGGVGFRHAPSQPQSLTWKSEPLKTRAATQNYQCNSTMPTMGDLDLMMASQMSNTILRAQKCNASPLLITSASATLCRDADLYQRAGSMTTDGQAIGRPAKVSLPEPLGSTSASGTVKVGARGRRRFAEVLDEVDTYTAGTAIRVSRAEKLGIDYMPKIQLYFSKFGEVRKVIPVICNVAGGRGFTGIVFVVMQSVDAAGAALANRDPFVVGQQLSLRLYVPKDSSVWPTGQEFSL